MKAKIEDNINPNIDILTERIIPILNNKIVPMFIKEKNVEKLKKIISSEFNDNEVYKTFQYIFENVKSPKVLNLIGEKLAKEIIAIVENDSIIIPTDVLNIRIVNKLADDKLAYYLSKIEDKQNIAKIFSLLSQEKIEYFFSNLKNIEINITKIVKTIPKKYLSKLLMSISIKSATYIFKDNTIDNEIKNSLISLRQNDVDSIIQENIKLYNTCYYFNRLSDMATMYEPLLRKIIKGLNINELFKEISYDNIPEKINDLMTEIKKEEVEKYILSLEKIDIEMIKRILNSFKLSQDIIYSLLDKISFQYFIEYSLYSCNFIPKDMVINYFIKNENKVYDYYKQTSHIINTSKIIFAKNVPDKIKDNLINMISEETIKFIFFDCGKELDTSLKKRIYRIRKKEINKLINDKLFYLLSFNSREEILAYVRSQDTNSLKEIFPLYNINDKSLFSATDFIIDEEILLLIQNILSFDDLFNKMNQNNTIDNRIKLLNELSTNDLINMFLRQAGMLSFNYEQKKNILNFMYTNRKEEIINYADNHKEIYNILLKVVDESEVEKLIVKYNLDELIIILKDRDYPEYVTNTILKKIVSSIEDTKGLNLYEILPIMQNSTLKFVLQYSKIINFIKKNIPNINTFVKHAFFECYDWVSDICNIINNNEEEKFNKICNTLLIKVYNATSDNLILVESFLNLVKNYNRYPELCISIAGINRELTDDEIMKIKYIFENNDELEGNMIPKSVEELNKVINGFSSKILSLINNSYDDDNETIKNKICLVLFNNDLQTVSYYLNTYGNTMELKKLKFNNRKNNKVCELINEMIIYVSIMEDVLNIDTNDRERLIQLLNNIYNNYEDISKISMFFSHFEQKMKSLYELDSQVNLTKINSEEVNNSLLNKELTEKYGVPVLDFSDRNYLLYVHIKSSNETVEELINGISSRNKNFICLAAIGNRCQNYYECGNQYGTIRFGYDEIPSGNFICSSKENMRSNAAIKENSNDVKKIIRVQRGILESCDNGIGSNSEALFFREGLKPKCIIIPKGEEISSEILEIVIKYGLKIVITQGKGQTIENPKPIFEDDKMQLPEKTNEEKIEKLQLVKKELLAKKEESIPRRIAIFTDAHGLFEPTLAILEDARKNGISEIYSLGDNIGTGPNPGEVIELLEEYGVKSVKGNHELYTLLGPEPFTKHLEKTNAINETKRNSTWTRLKLTDKQLEIIRNYPNQIELTIGDKKVLLRHFIKDFNTDNVVINQENYDKIFQGHIHFESSNEKVNTLRGVGIGYTPDNPNIGKASYIIITEKDSNDFAIEKREVIFDLNNLGHTINTSDLYLIDKKKIVCWSGIKTTRR